MLVNFSRFFLVLASDSSFVLSSHTLFIIQGKTLVSTWGSVVPGLPPHHLAFIDFVDLNFMAYVQGCNIASSEDMTTK